MVEAVKKDYPSSGGEDTDSTTQWEDCQGQFVRSAYGMRDIVAAICHNTLARKSGMVFQSWLLIGEARKRRWKGNEGYSMPKKRKGGVMAQSRRKRSGTTYICFINKFTAKTAL